MKKCMYCGQENEDTSAVCIKCGNTLLDIPTDQMPPLEEAHEEKPVQGSVPVQSAAGQEAAAETQQQVTGNTGYTGTGYASQGYPGAGYPQQGFQGEGYPQQGYPQQGFQGEGYPQQGYPGAGNPQQGFQGEGYPQQGYPGNMQQGYPSDGYSQQGYPSDGYSQQGYPGAGFPQQNQNYPGGYPQDLDDEEEDLPSPSLMLEARKMVKSPLFFISILCYTISVIGGIVYNVTGGSLTNMATFANTLKGFTGDNMVLDYLNKGIAYVQTQDAGNTVLTRLAESSAFLPSVLIMIGLWIAFISISPKRETAGTGGLTLIRVILILRLIVICAALLAGIGVCVAYVVAAGAAQTMMTLIVGIVALLVTVIFTVLTILYNIQLLFSVRAVRHNVRNGRDIGSIPGFLIVITILGLILSVLSVVMKAPDDYIGLVSGGAHAAWLLFIIIWAIVYKVKVKAR